MSGITCEIIKDLLPSVADGIASDETKRAVEEHVKDCPGCRAALESMRGADEKETAGDEREIDYLRKNRKRNRRIVLLSGLAALLIVAGFVFVKLFVIGNTSNTDSLNCRVEVDGRLVKVDCSAADGSRGIRSLEFSEENGVVTISTRTVLGTLFGAKEVSGEYAASEDISKVVFNNGVLWRRRDESFSSALKTDLKLNWGNWEKLTETEQMLSNTMPGHLTKLFWTWDSAEEYLGTELFNPLEGASWLREANYTGADSVRDSSLDPHHASAYVVGDEDGGVLYASLTAGYTVDAVPQTAQTSGGTFTIELNPSDGTGSQHESGSSTVIVIGGSGKARVTYTAEPVIRAVGMPAESFETLGLESGLRLFCRRTSGEKQLVSEVFFDLDGVHYTVRITVESGNEDLLDVTTGKITRLIETKLSVG